jgi:hypothetical protein
MYFSVGALTHRYLPTHEGGNIDLWRLQMFKKKNIAIYIKMKSEYSSLPVLIYRFHPQ